MSELDDTRIFESVTNSIKTQLGVKGIKKIASGNEFCILLATLSDEKDHKVVVKVPKDKIYSNVNDPHVSSHQLLDQEYNLLQYVKLLGFGTVPMPIRQLEAAGYPALVMTYIENDLTTPTDPELGKLLAQIHSLKLPDFALRAQENLDMSQLIPERLDRRWRELDKYVEHLPRLPDKIALERILKPLNKTRRLLHMDFRRANLLTLSRKVVAVIDWSNALIGHPALELARVAETGETGSLFIKGYSSVLPIEKVDIAAETLLRLDTSTMLALVFLSEEPDPIRARFAVKRSLALFTDLIKAM